jgi:GNAT superfamily N-acetyltransferase
MVYLLVANFGGQVVASYVLTIIPNLTRGARPYGLIENVVTYREYRHQGIGSRLLGHALQVAHEKGCYKVMFVDRTTAGGDLSILRESRIQEGRQN